MPHCFRPGVHLSGQSMSGLAKLDNTPSTTTCAEVSTYAPQQTHAFPMPHLSRTGNNPHPLSRARTGANRALHPLPRSRPQRARNSLANARSSLATQSSQTRRHERLVRPLEEPALVLRRASLTRLRVQFYGHHCCAVATAAALVIDPGPPCHVLVTVCGCAWVGASRCRLAQHGGQSWATSSTTFCCSPVWHYSSRGLSSRPRACSSDAAPLLSDAPRAVCAST